MNIKHIIFFFLSVLSTKYSYSQYLEFIENKGQWANNIAYKGELNTGAIALKPDGGYRMLQHNTQDLEAIHNYYHPHNNTQTENATATNNLGLHSHVYEVSFLGCNPTPQAIAEKPQDTYNNYFIDNDKSKWASGCKIFQAVTYKNIYPNIDVRYYTGNGSLKYDFIVHPGGNPNQIALVFDGTDDLKIKKGKLVITTSVTEEKELAPYTFQPSEKGKKEVNCSYHLNQNIITFNVDDYDKTQTLIIDPIKVFATFTGSKSDNWGFTATYDAAGNFYAGGIVFGSGFPISNGSSFQGSLIDDGEGGLIDIGIIKFNALGNTRMYATYIGGSNGNEQPHSLVANKNGDLLIVGRTSSANYPATFPLSGAGGGKDIIVTKLDNTGSILASRVIGGSGNDGMNIKAKYNTAVVAGTETTNRNYGDDARSEVILDDAENVLLTSCTQSTDFFVTANAFQKTNGGINTAMARKQDAVFIRLSPDLSNVLTSTYIGGNNDDAGFVLAINPISKNIYIAGGTASTNFPGDKTNVISANFNGGDCDGFIAILNTDGTLLLKSSYFGTNGGENIYGVQFDKFGFAYFMGTTNGLWQVINAPYFNQDAKQFICKIQNDLSAYIYSTTFGTAAISPNISPTAFLVDRCQNVYVSGWGGSVNTGRNYQSSGTAGMRITTIPPYKALQPTTDGNDFYFFVLERGAKSQLYGDFFGQNGGRTGEHVDGGTSRFDKEGIIYQSLCANCGADVPFPTTPGAYSTINGATNCNLAAIKIAFNFAGIGAGVRSSIKGVKGDTSGCVPLLIKFEDTLAQGISYTWNFGDNTPSIVTATPNTSHQYNAIGTYVVRLISIDSSTCNIVDTSYKTMRIRSDSAHLKVTYKKVGDCFNNNFEFDNTGSLFPPLKSFKTNSFSIYFGEGTPQTMGFGTKQHQYIIPGFYKGWMALVDTNYCNTPDTTFFELEVIANVKAKFTPPPKGCLSAPMQFTNQSNGAERVLWDFGDGIFSADKNAAHLFTASGIYTVTLYAFNTFSCNLVDSIKLNIEVSISPKSIFSYLPNPPRTNTPINFTNSSIGAVNYMWTFGDGDTIKTNNINASIKHLYQITKKFNACLTVYNLFGCTDTSCKLIQARVNQIYDVASAVAPNGNGANTKVFVRGYGIKKMNWNIYNRWGILIFTSNDITIGWDGKFKGELQPQDVYHYTLTVEFWDDKQETKTGDITLLR